MKHFILFLPMVMLSACSSAPKNDGNTVDLSRIGQEEILQKYGKDDSLKSADPFVVKSGVVTATAMVTIPGDHRPEAGIKMAQAQGTATLATTVERRIETALQVSSDVTNRILDDLVAATQPRFMRVTAKFYVRGGIFTNVVAEHRKAGWQPLPKVDLLQFATQSNTRG